MLRPCIVAGPKAPALADAMPWRQLPGVVQSATRAVPLLKMPIPDPGFPLQLVHHDDVAAAIALAATTDAPPGAYNIAGDGEVSISEVVTALGGHPVRVPAVAATAALTVIAHMPFVPSGLEWLHVARASVVMDTSKAKSQLGWKPTYTSAETLQALAEAVYPVQRHSIRRTDQRGEFRRTLHSLLPEGRASTREALVRAPVGTSRFVIPPPFPYSGRRREAKQVNRPGSCWVEVSPPHTGRLSAGAAHSSQTPRWEPGGQDWLSASGTSGSRSGDTAATPTSIL